MRAVCPLDAQGEKGAKSAKRYQIVPAIEEPRVKPCFGDDALGVGPELSEHSVNLLGCAQVNKASAEWAMRACNPAFRRGYRDEAPVFPCNGTMRIHSPSPVVFHGDQHRSCP